MNRYVSGFCQYRLLLWELVKKGIKLKYRRSYLGIVWTLLEPLLQTVVLTIVFGTLLGTRTKTFAVYILAGRLLYSFFSGATKGAMRSIRSNSAMIKKVYVPKYLYPLSAVLYNYVIFLISLIVLAIVSLVFGVYPTWNLFLALIPLVLVLIFALGVGMILGTISVFFRDMEYLWDVALMLIMYTCAIFYYPEKIINSGYGFLLKWNPLYCLIANFRAAVFGDPFNWTMIGYAGICSAVVVVLGFYMFYKNQDKFILHI